MLTIDWARFQLYFEFKQTLIMAIQPYQVVNNEPLHATMWLLTATQPPPHPSPSSARARYIAMYKVSKH